MTPPPNPLAIIYTVDQFCAMMQHSRDKFEDLVRRGELAAFKVGRRTYVAKEEAERWLRETQVRYSVGNDDAKNVGNDAANVGISDATPDQPTSSDCGMGHGPAAGSGKRKRQSVETTRT